MQSKVFGNSAFNTITSASLKGCADKYHTACASDVCLQQEACTETGWP